jgi:hypothetical protein
MLKLWVPMGPYVLQEILFPPEAVEVLLRVAVHEAGHAEVASHFGARVLGIALTFEPVGLIAMAIYVLPNNLAIEDICTIYAAGSAGEILEYGDYNAMGASRDLEDISALRAEVPFEPLVEKAKTILMERRARFDRITGALRDRFFSSNNQLTMGLLPNGRLGVFIINEDDLR